MKAFYWILSGIALTIGILAVGVWASPDTTSVGSDALDEWFRAAGFIAAVTGIIVGAAGGALVDRQLRLKPGEIGAHFNNRVIWFGIILVILSALLVAGLLVGSAARTTEWQLGQGERAMLVLYTRRFYGLALLGLAVAAIVFATVTRVRSWNGRRALL